MSTTDRIYVGQNSLRIRMKVGQDITDANTLQIGYKDPGGNIAYWTATEEDATAGIIYYDVVNTSELDEDGVWSFWAKVTFSDARVGLGLVNEVNIFTEGSVLLS